MKIPTAIEFVESIQRSVRDEKSESLIEEQAKSLISEFYCNQITEALKKQIPKKIKLIHKVDSFGMHFNDPMCGCGCSFYYIGRVKYCPMCGQAIDWSEE